MCPFTRFPLRTASLSQTAFTIETIRKSVDTFTGHGISKEYATKVKDEILPNQTVETLNAMIHNARSARGGFSHSLMAGRPPKVKEEEEETTK